MGATGSEALSGTTDSTLVDEAIAVGSVWALAVVAVGESAVVAEMLVISAGADAQEVAMKIVTVATSARVRLAV